MFRPALLFFLLGCSVLSGQSMRYARHGDAVPANQLMVAGNACGPAALLNAFRCGNESWQRPLARLQGTTDRERILSIIRQYGGRPSKSLKNHQRWSRRGINLNDLTDIANEMTTGLYLPRLGSQVFFSEKNQAPGKLLQKVHQQLGKSLSRGFPPILSVRRFAFRKGEWVVIEAHFITLTALPEKLDQNATGFSFEYLDPWGGKRCRGDLMIPSRPLPAGVPSNLEILIPQTPVGKNLVKPGEPSTILFAAAIGRW